jgi:hypothetical protein
MNKLLKEFLSSILITESESTSKQAKTMKLKFIRGSRKYWSNNGKPPATHKTDDSGTIVTITGEKPDLPTGEKESGEKVSPPETGGTKEPDTAQPDGAAGITPGVLDPDKSNAPVSVGTLTTNPKMGSKFKHQEIYDEFNSVMASENQKQIQEFIKKYGVLFNPENNTFYITSDGKGNKINSKAGKIFGSGKGKGAGRAQKALHDRLTSMGVTVTIIETSSVYAPAKIAPQSSRTNFGKVATSNPDGSITITDSSGRATTYETIDDVQRWTEDRFEEWTNSPEGQNASEEERRKIKERLVVTGFAISERNRTLRELLNGDEPVAMYDTPERQEEYVRSLESTVTATISDVSRKERISAKFQQYRETKTPEEAAEVLSEILSELEDEAGKNKNKELKKSGAIPAIAEGFTAMVEMKRGRMVVVPLRENFTASDVVSLSTEETKELSTGELVNKVKLIYVGISVKFGKGGASSMIEKAKLSVFRDHKQTRVTLDVLATKSSEKGSIFDTDEPKRTARRQEVRETIEPHVQEVSDYYGFNPAAKDVDQLIEWLGRGEPECVDGKVVPRRNPPPPVGKGKKSEAGKDPSGNAVDVEGWAYTWAAQGAYAAIYNSRVLGQAFASQTWKPGLDEVDGITGFTKQIPQPLKQAKKDSSGLTYQPDTLVTFNKPTSSEEELRSGNPCD